MTCELKKDQEWGKYLDVVPLKDNEFVPAVDEDIPLEVGKFIRKVTARCMFLYPLHLKKIHEYDDALGDGFCRMPSMHLRCGAVKNETHYCSQSLQGNKCTIPCGNIVYTQCMGNQQRAHYCKAFAAMEPLHPWNLFSRMECTSCQNFHYYQNYAFSPSSQYSKWIMHVKRNNFPPIFLQDYHKDALDMISLDDQADHYILPEMKIFQLNPTNLPEKPSKMDIFLFMVTNWESCKFPARNVSCLGKDNHTCNHIGKDGVCNGKSVVKCMGTYSKPHFCEKLAPADVLHPLHRAHDLCKKCNRPHPGSRCNEVGLELYEKWYQSFSVNYKRENPIYPCKVQASDLFQTIWSSKNEYVPMDSLDSEGYLLPTKHSDFENEERLCYTNLCTARTQIPQVQSKDGTKSKQNYMPLLLESVTNLSIIPQVATSTENENILSYKDSCIYLDRFVHLHEQKLKQKNITTDLVKHLKHNSRKLSGDKIVSYFWYYRPTLYTNLLYMRQHLSPCPFLASVVFLSPEDSSNQRDYCSGKSVPYVVTCGGNHEKPHFCEQLGPVDPRNPCNTLFQECVKCSHDLTTKHCFHNLNPTQLRCMWSNKPSSWYTKLNNDSLQYQRPALKYRFTELEPNPSEMSNRTYMFYEDSVLYFTPQFEIVWNEVGHTIASSVAKIKWKYNLIRYAPTVQKIQGYLETLCSPCQHVSRHVRCGWSDKHDIDSKHLCFKASQDKMGQCLTIVHVPCLGNKDHPHFCKELAPYDKRHPWNIGLSQKSLFPNEKVTNFTYTQWLRVVAQFPRQALFLTDWHRKQLKISNRSSTSEIVQREQNPGVSLSKRRTERNSYTLNIKSKPREMRCLNDSMNMICGAKYGQRHYCWQQTENLCMDLKETLKLECGNDVMVPCLASRYDPHYCYSESCYDPRHPYNCDDKVISFDSTDIQDQEFRHKWLQHAENFQPCRLSTLHKQFLDGVFDVVMNERMGEFKMKTIYSPRKTNFVYVSDFLSLVKITKSNLPISNSDNLCGNPAVGITCPGTNNDSHLCDLTSVIADLECTSVLNVPCLAIGDDYHTCAAMAPIDPRHPWNKACPFCMDCLCFHKQCIDCTKISKDKTFELKHNTAELWLYLMKPFARKLVPSERQRIFSLQKGGYAS